MVNFSGRFLSLDVFRGVIVAFMILVNNQYVGSAFGQLRHSSWDGCTVTDLVFPFFLFIVGASFFFVAEKRGFTVDKMVYRKIMTLLWGILVVLQVWGSTYLLYKRNVFVKL